MRMTFTHRRDVGTDERPVYITFARVELVSLGLGAYELTGQSGGEDVGRVFKGPGARERAMHAAVHLAYGKGLPELGARSGDTLLDLPALIELHGKAA